MGEPEAAPRARTRAPHEDWPDLFLGQIPEGWVASTTLDTLSGPALSLLVESFGGDPV